MMMVAEKKIARFTSAPAMAMVPSRPVRPPGAGCPSECSGSARWRKTFSTMMTVASTIRPKSMAPSDRRLAESPRTTRIRMAKPSAKGIVAATMIALRRLPRNSHCTTKTSTTPKTRLCITVCVVVWISPERS
ncbi:hypothetical protein MPOCJGCO_4493 [Methylobacterium trifolii]|uniref:Uncharacterized protein n=1 Tax=Methylobacterium trifolii TaxID=1003092 RepID=A0ABQ4U9E7_9HYPH|nr:hypothetical protein MPOCJGCO_4493 [Methylobacterium trifolii]